MKLSEKRAIFFEMLSRMRVEIQPVLDVNGMILYIKELYRTPEKQLEYYKAGKSRTLYGTHLIGLAGDLVIIKNNKFLVDAPLYGIMGEWWIEHGGRWGGEWKDPYDPFHFEFNQERWGKYLESLNESGKNKFTESRI